MKKSTPIPIPKQEANKWFQNRFVPGTIPEDSMTHPWNCMICDTPLSEMTVMHFFGGLCHASCSSNTQNTQNR